MTQKPLNSNDIPEEDLDSPEAIAAGSLAIQNANNELPKKELWERSASNKGVNLPADGTSALRFYSQQARIMPPNNDDPAVKRYVVYKLIIHLDTSIIDPLPAVIDRRYTDFLRLYSSLKKTYPTEMVSVDFPSKAMWGNFTQNLAAERSSAYETLLTHIANQNVLRDSSEFLYFLQDQELSKACKLLDERRYENAIPLLENCFLLLSKVYMDRSKPVLLMLCRLLAACTTSPIPHPSADRWAYLALSRFDTLCDIDLLPLYIPLLHTCEHLWWQRGRDKAPLTERLTEMSKKGINTKSDVTLMQAIHNLDPRTEII